MHPRGEQEWWEPLISCEVFICTYKNYSFDFQIVGDDAYIAGEKADARLKKGKQWKTLG